MCGWMHAWEPRPDGAHIRGGLVQLVSPLSARMDVRVCSMVLAIVRDCACRHVHNNRITKLPSQIFAKNVKLTMAMM